MKRDLLLILALLLAGVTFGCSGVPRESQSPEAQILTPPAPAPSSSPFPPPSASPTPLPLASPSVSPSISPTVPENPKWALWEGGTQLRGANIYQRRVYPELDEGFLGNGAIGPPFTQKDFDALAALGANYVNLSHPGLFSETPPYQLDSAIQDNLDALLAMAANANLYVVITFRTGPGRSEFWAFWGEDTSSDPSEGWFREDYYNNTVWGDAEAQEAWAAMWRYTAQRYGNNPIVIGYDLMCEPNANEVGSYPLGEALDVWDAEAFYQDYGGTLYDWNQFYPKIAEAIRQVDESTPLLIGGMGYSAVDWLPFLEPIDDPYTVYTIHQYEPMSYTHQISGTNGYTYPGFFDTDWDDTPDAFDQTWLADLLSTVEAFQEAHHVHVAVNEYGVHRWAPGAADFMRDQMTLFEQLGLNYALWEWQTSFEPFASSVDAFDFRHGENPINHTHVPNALQSAIVSFWAANKQRPFP